VEWTEGRALIATGSPFAPVNHHGKLYNISQCNKWHDNWALTIRRHGLDNLFCEQTRLTRNAN
jgi:hypothetical protein